jgi:hypothetical protein
MSISIVTNFKVNTYSPIDTRLVATNSAALSEIEFPYEGLTVYTKEQNLNYTYNGTAWQVSSNGVYGGSGSLAGNTDVNTGSVGGVQNDKSYDYILSASSSDDRAQMVTSFIRNNNGTDYETVEVRNQVKYVDNVRGVLNGPYISFNKNDSKKGIISLGTPDRNFTTTVERFRIEPDSTSNNGAIVLLPSTYSHPLYISQNSTYNTFIGYNWNGVTKFTSGTSSSIISFSNGEISFSNISRINEVVNKQLIIGENDNNKNSVVQIRVDSSFGEYGSSISGEFVTKTIPDIIRTIEHRYTKTQHLGYKKLESYINQGSTVTMKFNLVNFKIVTITGDGNFFDFELPVRSTAIDMFDINIVRFDSLGFVELDDIVPAGTEITIRFTYESPPGANTTRIYLWQNSSQTTRKIKSSYADTSGGEYITILHDPIVGDIITFRKGGGSVTQGLDNGDGFWYITNINRERQIISSISTSSLTWYDISDLTNGVILKTPNIQKIYFQGSYIYKDVPGTAINFNSSGAAAGSLDHPFKHQYSNTQNFLFSNVVASRPLRVAKDISGNVYMKGSFSIILIPYTELSRNYQYGIGNKFYIAYFQNNTWYPKSSNPIGDNQYTTWGLCEVIISCDTPIGMPFSQQNSGAVFLPGRISVDLAGRIFLQFHMSFWGGVTLAGNYRIDVNVPQFSYSLT